MAKLVSQSNTKIYEQPAGNFGTIRVVVINDVISEIEYAPSDPNNDTNPIKITNVEYAKALLASLQDLFNTLSVDAQAQAVTQQVEQPQMEVTPTLAEPTV